MKVVISLILVVVAMTVLLSRAPASSRSGKPRSDCGSSSYQLECSVASSPSSPSPSPIPEPSGVTPTPTSTATPIPSSTPVPSKWEVSSSTSPVDDSQTVILRLAAENLIPIRFNQTYQPTLYLRCEEKKTQAYVSFGTFLGTTSADVTYRLDKEKAVTRGWSVSTDYKAAFVPGGDVSFVKQMLNHDELFVRITPYGESPVSTSFDLRGLKAAVKPLQEACKWK